MRAAVLPSPGNLDSNPLILEDRDEPEPRPGELVLEVTACGVCRTDLQIVEGDLETRVRPIVPGHQVVGRVRAVGKRVDDWTEGDRAGVGWMALVCGTCRFCMAGRENLCERARFTGWDRDGGFAERLTADARFALPLPDGPPDADLAPLLCGGVIGYRALRRSGIEPGERLGLFGFGASALLAIQVAVHEGCEVFVVTRSERSQDRARELGAVWAGSSADDIPKPLDAAVTFAPAGEVVIDALSVVDRGGVVAVNAIHLDRIPEFDYDRLWLEREIRSVANYTRDDALEFLRLAAEIPIRTVVDAFPLEQANRALRAVRDGTIRGAAVLEMG
jgi:propanol-preferring alcohol dehydrogenase